MRKAYVLILNLIERLWRCMNINKRNFDLCMQVLSQSGSDKAFLNQKMQDKEEHRIQHQKPKPLTEKIKCLILSTPCLLRVSSVDSLPTAIAPRLQTETEGLLRVLRLESPLSPGCAALEFPYLPVAGHVER